jgi:hypothetical protein
MLWIGIVLKPIRIHMRIQPQVLHMLKNRGEILTFSQSNASLQYFPFLASFKGVMILSILDCIETDGEKSENIHVLLGLIPIWIRQNDADPTRSGSITLAPK